jgi:hypothetical protein
MVFFKRLKLIQKALHFENELHLAYLWAYGLDTNTFLKEREFRFTGVILRSLYFLRHLFSLFFSAPVIEKHNPTDFYIYASTDNQFRSLLSTIKALQKYDEKVVVVCGASVRRHDDCKVESIAYNKSDVLIALILFFLRAPKLYYQLRKLGNKTAIKKYFDYFFRAYLHLPYFIRVLDAKKISYIIIANDHNIETRSLRLAANILGVKTIFMQHGSGSEFLPPLEFTYAFLDGWVSVDKYIECNKSIIKTKRKLYAKNTTIFLSGIKKMPAFVKDKKQDDFVIGVAINPYDDINSVILLLTDFLDKGLVCLVRAHPSQLPHDIDILKQLHLRYKNLRLSHFKEETSSQFLQNCDLLISGNSGIHLEAAIAHVATYYFEFGASTLPKDYYRHVREGIAKEFPVDYRALMPEDLKQLSLIDDDTKTNIKRFSESFGTQWEGHEGELVAQTLIKLNAQGDVVDLYRAEKNDINFKAIYTLKNT